jgi:hypothetical protein
MGTQCYVLQRHFRPTHYANFWMYITTKYFVSHIRLKWRQPHFHLRRSYIHHIGIINGNYEEQHYVCIKFHRRGPRTGKKTVKGRTHVLESGYTIAFYKSIFHLKYRMVSLSLLLYVCIYIYIYIYVWASGNSQLMLGTGVSYSVTKVITSATPSKVRLVVELSL